jgi:hypothetical protein
MVSNMSVLPPILDDDDERTLLEKVEKLQAGMIACATQNGGIDRPTYERLRLELFSNSSIRPKVPEIVRKYRDQGQFWQFIKYKFAHTQSAASLYGASSGRLSTISNCRSARPASSRSPILSKPSTPNTFTLHGRERLIGEQTTRMGNHGRPHPARNRVQARFWKKLARHTPTTWSCRSSGSNALSF